MGKNFEGIKRQRFGVELEMTGLARAEAAKAIAGYFGTEPLRLGYYSSSYFVRDHHGRKWQFVFDGSIDCSRYDRESEKSAYSVEFVTPICTYEDIPIIQELVRVLRKAGAVCNSSTGIHIHIDAAPYDAKHLRNLVNIIASKEDMIYHALRVGDYRSSYCKKTDPEFLGRLNRIKPKTMEAFERIWYDGPSHSHEHYHESRYRLCNLHSVFQKGTIEIRAFNSTLHAGVLRAYISLCLAISNQALTQNSASARPTHSENEKYTFRCWLLRLGLNGDEFKNVRKHLLSHLEGNIAWLHPEDAIAQREGLKQERIAAREAGVAPEHPQPTDVPMYQPRMKAPQNARVTPCMTMTNRWKSRCEGGQIVSKKARKTLYLAYGSNINLDQMKFRCPTAKRVDTAILNGYELEFRGVATIVPKPDAAVPVLLWELEPPDERALDRYEGYPHLYRKEMLEIEVNGEKREAMAYLMNGMSVAPPSRAYYEAIRTGYLANDMDTRYLDEALERSYAEFQNRSISVLDDEEYDEQEFETETAVDRLVGKINSEYSVLGREWQQLSPEQLIEQAERIAAAKFIKANIGSCILDDTAEYLERFKNPLETLIHTIMYRYDPQNIAEREWFSDHLYDLLDKHDLDTDFETEDEEADVISSEEIEMGNMC